jgi:hypothetical protein
MSIRIRPAVAGLVLAAVGLTVLGCGTGRPPCFPVTGKVTFQKKTPAAGALVVFHPTDPAVEKQFGGKPFAKVNEDGTFTLTTYSEQDGAPEGEYGVTIDWRGKAKDGKPSFSLGEGGAVGQPLLNPKYSNPQQPAFKVTVKKGQPNEFTFEVD